MLSAFRCFRPTLPSAHTHASLYSVVAGLARTDWRTDGHPAPQPVSLDDVDYDDTSPSPHSQVPPHRRKPSKIPTPHEWAEHRKSMKKDFPEGWAPTRKLSRQAMDGLRSMHAMHPEIFTTPVLAEKFKISAEAVRRILKSKWEPTREERARFAERERRNRQKWIEEKRMEERQKYMAQVQESGPLRKPSRNDRLMFV
ncbi:uncharacterized protein FIBRA_01623 [Fibroporia radiculosa]|uniref:Required for respiratory growth protein 9, mitochondrial n=1 Tax=Fibroporia radiculosa TaxID=599839 RepID=J4GKT6_9APHY|nr:uncharacterized protein FIBRA_01623 [Fibroporia radiculosa]CCL99605.1 predicted protein [Fibroporia radiculosa]